MSKLFAKEADLVAVFRQWLAQPKWSGSRQGPGAGWTVYAETAGWDLLLSHDETKLQVGVEAKLALNAKVLSQALPPNRYASDRGPDYRAVLVPADACQVHMRDLAAQFGVSVLIMEDARWEGAGDPDWRCAGAELPQEAGRTWSDAGWFSWLPFERETLPDYVPDVGGGDSSPVALTPWKIKAIKLLILLERRGVVHRSDMRALDISPSRWTDRYHGFLTATPSGYVRCADTPDLQGQHPRNWSEIEADFDSWNPYQKWEAA